MIIFHYDRRYGRYLYKKVGDDENEDRKYEEAIYSDTEEQTVLSVDTSGDCLCINLLLWTYVWTSNCIQGLQNVIGSYRQQMGGAS